MPQHSGRSQALLSVLVLVLVLVLELALSVPVLARVGLRVWERLGVQVSVQGPLRRSPVPQAPQRRGLVPLVVRWTRPQPLQPLQPAPAARILSRRVHIP